MFKLNYSWLLIVHCLEFFFCLDSLCRLGVPGRKKPSYSFFPFPPPIAEIQFQYNKTHQFGVYDLVSFNKCFQSCSQHYNSDIEHFHHPKKFLLCYFTVPSPHSNPWQPLICHYVLPLLELYRSGITQYTRFYLWLLSLNMLEIRPSYTSSSLLFMAEWFSTEWIICLSIHPLTGTSVVLCVGATMNKAPWIQSRSGLGDCWIVKIAFWKFSKMIVQLHSPV